MQHALRISRVLFFMSAFSVLPFLDLAAGLTAANDKNSDQADSGDSQSELPKPVPKTHDRQSHTDLLGDPLPAAALLRLGTMRFHPPSGVTEIALSPDEQTVVTVGDQLIVWDPQTGRELWRAEADQFGMESRGSRYGSRPIAFSSDSSKFFTTNGPNQIAIWDIATKNREVLTIKTEAGDAQKQRDKTLSLDVTSDGTTFALGRADSIVVCDRQGKVKFTIKNTANSPLAIGRDRLAFFGHYAAGRFSPDGSKLAVLTSDHPEELRIHDSETGRELRKIALTSKLVRLAYSPDGKHLVATERDSAIRMYDVTTGARVWECVLPLHNPFENYTSGVAYSPDGKTIAAGATDHHIHLLDPSNGKEIGVLTGTHWYPWTLVFTSNSKMLYSSGWDGTIRRWNVAERKQLPLPIGIHASEVVAASPDGQTLAFQDDRRTVHLVKSDTGEELRQMELPGMHFSQLQFSPDGQLLAGGGSSGDHVQVVLWNVANGEQVRLWSWPKGRDPHSQVESLCFTPDGRRLAAAVFRQSAAYIWDLASDQQIAKLTHLEVYGLSFSPNGETLATAGWDSIIRFWNADTGKLVREFAVSTEKAGDKKDDQEEAVARPADQPDLNHRVGDLRMYTVCYSPEGDLLATAHLNGEVWIWQADTMQPRMKFQVQGRFVYGALSFSPDGLWLATGAANGSIELWDPLTGQKVWDQGKHQHYAYSLGFGRDNRTIVSGADDGLCYLWDLRPQSVSHQNDDWAKLWHDFSGDDSLLAYQALWTMSESPARAVEFVAEKLRQVRTLTDTDRFAEGISAEENQRRKRLKKLLAAKDPKIELTIVARRAVSLLEQISTPTAIHQLEELAKRNPDSDLARLAMHALNRCQIGRK